jgi:hypothetical protein
VAHELIFSAQSRRTVSRFVLALLVAVALFAVAVESGAAKPYSTGASQNGFVAACRGAGGTPKRLATRVVQCTLPNGYVMVCNFNSGLCVDFPPATIVTTGSQTNQVTTLDVAAVARGGTTPRSTLGE